MVIRIDESHNECVCVYVCVLVCVCVCVCVFVWVWVCLSVCIYIYIIRFDTECDTNQDIHCDLEPASEVRPSFFFFFFFKLTCGLLLTQQEHRYSIVIKLWCCQVGM